MPTGTPNALHIFDRWIIRQLKLSGRGLSDFMQICVETLVSVSIQEKTHRW